MKVRAVLVGTALGLTLAVVGCADQRTSGLPMRVGPRPTTTSGATLSRIAAGSGEDHVLAWTRVPDEEVVAATSNFTDIGGLDDVAVCRARLATSATVSLDLSGGPAEIRVIAYVRPDDPVELKPGPVVAQAPGGSVESFAFTFIKPRASREATTYFSVQWRSVAEPLARLHSGTLILEFGRREADKQLCA